MNGKYMGWLEQRWNGRNSDRLARMKARRVRRDTRAGPRKEEPVCDMKSSGRTGKLK